MEEPSQAGRFRLGQPLTIGVRDIGVTIPVFDTQGQAQAIIEQYRRIKSPQGAASPYQITYEHMAALVAEQAVAITFYAEAYERYYAEAVRRGEAAHLRPPTPGKLRTICPMGAVQH